MAKAAILSDRAVLKVSGEDAEHFLHNLVTNSIEGLPAGEARYAALLSPQGKIISDFLVVATEVGFLLDVPKSRVEELKKRLTLYKLRAKVTLTIEDAVVAAIFDGSGSVTLTEMFADPRIPGLGFRVFLPSETASDVLELAELKVVDEDEYASFRIALGVPESGRDFAFDDAFPHEADMDQLAGIDFRKGCYIGQEIVSRMQHRGTARTRLVPVRILGSAEPGAEVTAGGKPLGTLGSVDGERGIAMIRIDRADDALAAGEPITAGTATLIVERPNWARFRFPGDPLPDAAS